MTEPTITQSTPPPTGCYGGCLLPGLSAALGGGLASIFLSSGAATGVALLCGIIAYTIGWICNRHYRCTNCGTSLHDRHVNQCPSCQSSL